VNIGRRLMPSEANSRLEAIQAYAAGGLGTTVLAASTMLSGGTSIVMALGGATAMLGAVAMRMSRRVTPRLPDEQRLAIRRTVECMMAVAANGIEEPGRIDAEADIRLMAMAVRTMTDMDPWTISDHEMNSRFPMPPQLEARAAMLEKFAMRRWLKGLENVKGTDKEIAKAQFSVIVPLVVVIAQEFGIDTGGLTPPREGLPGRRMRPAKIAEKADVRPTSHAHALAQEWLSGDRDGVDILIRIEADAAAGRDLRRLDEAWMAARSVTTDDVSSIDIRYERGAERLAETLQEAIDLRARTALQTLDTHVRYLESKHAA
jgi:hypothetical protein